MYLWQSDFLKFARSEGADLRLVPKKDSILMQIFSKILFFNRRFDEYVSTIGETVYAPSIEKMSLAVLAHEVQHRLDAERFGLLFSLGYLFPQVLALLSLFSFWSLWWLCCLIFLLPWPSPFRMMIERRAYLVNLLVWRWQRGEIRAVDQLNVWRKELRESNWAVSEFKSGAYYWMWPFTRSLERWFFRKIGQTHFAESWHEGLKAFCETNRNV